ncbi:NAD(P)/FAD-dependent oxidoreductase [Ideonella sp. BN130291]|uniref:NAD(P)/FAD-dependent oxidoreductase n=1 Tax=Ideonella sp. BN130291 TaxID=3112940 RepID=UPI002E2578CA|nr:FAD-binding oxidoreductase [Ideonella sp. BN130291]
MPSFYHATADTTLRFAPLSGPADARVAIIGGGFAGLATAMSLVERGVRDIVLLEAETIGHGASGRNGGFVFGGFSLDNADLVRQVGAAEARRLYGLTLDAVERIRQRIQRHAIDCDAVYSGVLLANWFADDRPLRALQQFMHEQFQVDWRWLPREETRSLLLTERYHAALHEPNAFHFHPLKYAQGLARVLREAGVRLHEGTRVNGIVADGAGWRVSTPSGHVACEHAVVACGGYIGQLFKPLSRAIMPIATYVMTTEPLGGRLASAMRTTAAVYDTRFAFDYYRPLPDTRLLWGGRISIRDRSPQAVAQLLTRDLLRVYPQLQGVQVQHAWSGLMSYARHKMPQIGRLPRGPWYAMGFGGHGVGPTTLAGEVLAQALTGEAAMPAGFGHYGLPSTLGPLGLAAAQATYWWLQLRDALRG